MPRSLVNRLDHGTYLVLIRNSNGPPDGGKQARARERGGRQAKSDNAKFHLSLLHMESKARWKGGHIRLGPDRDTHPSALPLALAILRKCGGRIYAKLAKF